MPELPEVETTCRGIEKLTRGKTVDHVVIRQKQLRWEVPSAIKRILPGQSIQQITRRGKYIIVHTKAGHLIIHLGMSGRLWVIDSSTPYQKHDHIDIQFNDGSCLRYHDPRRFGSMHWIEDEPSTHKLLKTLGVEPLSKQFTGEYLFTKSRKRQVAIKQFIMDSKIVVGVGNIYATEALFLSGIHPTKAAGKISKAKYELLIEKIKQVLKKAINAGGTTLKDFSVGKGKPGYFKQELQVYGKQGEPCPKCKRVLKKLVIGQRSTIYCSSCQR